MEVLVACKLQSHQSHELTWNGAQPTDLSYHLMCDALWQGLDQRQSTPPWKWTPFWPSYSRARARGLLRCGLRCEHLCTLGLCLRPQCCLRQTLVVRAGLGYVARLVQVRSMFMHLAILFWSISLKVIYCLAMFKSYSTQRSTRHKHSIHIHRLAVLCVTAAHSLHRTGCRAK